MVQCRHRLAPRKAAAPGKSGVGRREPAAGAFWRRLESLWSGACPVGQNLRQVRAIRSFLLW